MRASIVVALLFASACNFGSGTLCHPFARCPSPAQARETTAPVDALGLGTDFLRLTPTLKPAVIPATHAAVYANSQTGRVRFIHTGGAEIEAGTADSIFVAPAAPSAVLGRIWLSSITTQISYWDGAMWQILATSGGVVPNGRLINTTAPLAGGGDLSMDRTLSLTLAAVPGLQVSGGGLAVLPKPGGYLALDAAGLYLASTAVAAGSYPMAGQIPTFTVDAAGRLTAAGSTTTLTSPAIASAAWSGATTGAGTCGLDNGCTGQSNSNVAQYTIFGAPTSGAGPASWLTIVAGHLNTATAHARYTAGSTAAIGIATAYLVSPGQKFSPTEVAIGVATRSGNPRNLYCFATAAPGGADTAVYTVRKNSADSTLTCTMTGAATTCNDTTHTLTVAAGDRYSVKVVSTGVLVTGITCSFEETPG